MRKKTLFASALFLLILILGIRLFWTVAKTESGWTVLKQQWRDATLGFFIGDQIPIRCLEPTDQADFWLRETKRITSLEPNNAELAMGAAIVLDSLGSDFRTKYLTFSEDDTSPGIRWSMDFDKIDQAMNMFESKCQAQCLAMAAKATELQPDNVHWWRLRALLQFPSFYHSFDNKIRNSDWLKVLEQCKTHDPDNAIYDYLAALQLFHASIKYEFVDDKTNINITDPQQYAEAIHFFQNGQKKSHCIFGDEYAVAIYSFLSRSKASYLDQKDVATNREIYYQLHILPNKLGRTQNDRAEVLDRQGDIIGEVILLQETLYMLDQFSQSGENLVSNLYTKTNFRCSLVKLEKIAQEYPHLFSLEELTAIQTETDYAILDEKIFIEALKRSTQQQLKQLKQHVLLSSVSIPLFTDISLSAALPLLIAGLCCWMASKYIGKDRERAAGIMGLHRHATTWLASYILTFVALGLTAAHIIPPGVQGWILVVLGLSTCIVFTLWSLWRFVYLRKFQYTTRSLFVLTFLVAICCSILKLVSDYGFNILGDVRILDWIFFPAFAIMLWLLWRFLYRRNFKYTIHSLLALTFLVALYYSILNPANYYLGNLFKLKSLDDLYLSPHIPSDWYNMDDSMLRDIILVTFRTWLWPLMQWIAYSGPFVSIALSLALLTLWYNIRFNRIAPQTPDRSRARWIGLLTCLNRSLIAVAALWMILYLCIAPSSIKIAEADYQSKMTYIQILNKEKDAINAAIAEVRADKKWMDSIQAENP